MHTVLDDTHLDQRFAEIVAAITRREFVIGGLALGALTVAACGGDDGSAASTTGSGPTTRSFDTASGAVEIPVNPARVVCLDTVTPRVLLDVGYTPTGVPAWGSRPLAADYVDRIGAIDTVGDPMELQVEQVAALQPDLIIGLANDLTTAMSSQLSAIAPTVLLTFETGSQWVDVAAQAADAVGHGEALAQLVAAHAARVAGLRDDLADVFAETTWAIAVGFDGQMFLYLPDSVPGALLVELGAQFAAPIAGQTGNGTPVSYEEIGQLAGAGAILTDAAEDGTFTEATQALVDQPAFGALPAAVAGSVFATPRLLVSSYGEAARFLDDVERFALQLRALG